MNKLIVDIITWNKDTHELFDYESKEVKHQNKLITKNCEIYI